MMTSRIGADKSGLPLYMQVKEYLSDHIREHLKPGDMLPSQAEIAADTGTSMITVKRAIKELEVEGVLECRGGRRATVRMETALDSSHGFSSWTATVTKLGHKPKTVWSEIEEHVPEARIARLLNLRTREKTVEVRRLRSLDGEPLAIMTNELPSSLVPGLVEAGIQGESLYEDLQANYGWKPDSAEEEVTARKANKDEKKHFGASADIVLVITRMTYDAAKKPIEYATVIFPASRYRYRTQYSSQGGNTHGF